MAPTVLDAGKQIPKLGFLAGTGAECADVAPLGRQLATNFWDLAAVAPGDAGLVSALGKRHATAAPIRIAPADQRYNAAPICHGGTNPISTN